MLQVDRLKAKEGMQKKRAKQTEEERGTEKKAATDKRKELRKRMTEEEKHRVRQESRDWMQTVRSLRLQEEEEEEKEANRDRISKLRAAMTEEELDQSREADRVSKAKAREIKFEELKEFENTTKKLRMRTFRKERTGKDPLLQNLSSKQGMRLLESEGRLRDFKRRSHRNIEEMRDWENYMRKGKNYVDVLEVRKPDVVQRINEKNRDDEEKERAKREKANDEEWCYNGESGEYYWNGVGEPEYGDNFECEGLTGEELRKFREEENMMYKAISEERKKAQTEKGNKNKKIKKKL